MAGSIDVIGDGTLATFEAAAQAVRCTVAIREIADRQGIAIRAGVYVGGVPDGWHLYRVVG